MLALLAFMTTNCNNDGKCRISGTIPDRYDGKRIFLVPLTDNRREVVDSVVIENGRFEFVSDTLMMAKILVDYHYRDGVQPLLVVVEPGQVQVTIDSVSHAVGTPQNDSLDKWKGLKETDDIAYRTAMAEVYKLKGSGEQVISQKLKDRADSVHLVFKNYTRQMAVNLKEGLLHDFLKDMYPKTYKRMMPDSTVVVFDADTHEPVSQ